MIISIKLYNLYIVPLVGLEPTRTFQFNRFSYAFKALGLCYLHIHRT
nr:MAG TPA: hypothetical protein [Bacteriophage sp.]